MFAAAQTIHVEPSQAPMLAVVVDTEEEFDWSRSHDRGATSVRAMRWITRGQEICDRYGIVPTYLVDYPVATQAEGYEPLRGIHASGRALIGAHVHPWVNPPHDEVVCATNSYPGNLPRELEEEKLRRVSKAIESNFGSRPRIYKAGRYGVGPNTAEILEEQGFEIDLSVCPSFDWRADGGPDYSRVHALPFWFGRRRRMFGLPASSAFTGSLAALGPLIERHVRSPLLERLRVPGVLARLGIYDRLRLSPEGFTSTEHRKVTRALLRRGVRTFTWSFHSPSLDPGHTPYVRSGADLERFLDSFRRYFDYFFGELGGVAMTPVEIKQHLETQDARTRDLSAR